MIQQNEFRFWYVFVRVSILGSSPRQKSKFLRRRFLCSCFYKTNHEFTIWRFGEITPGWLFRPSHDVRGCLLDRGFSYTVLPKKKIKFTIVFCRSFYVVHKINWCLPHGRFSARFKSGSCRKSMPRVQKLKVGSTSRFHIDNRISNNSTNSTTFYGLPCRMLSVWIN